MGREKALAMILDLSNQEEVIATVRLAGKSNPPNWVRVSTHIRFRAKEINGKVLFAVRIRGDYSCSGDDSKK